ncbi:MAG: hypothetical protein BZY65_00635 [SAR202 cluster bacterium Ae2-Chloro-G2]|nr:MAG: hypothetical protein BZY65_00635 [SAR202 cluster bacterium Ae2-Chloro-G2]
MKVRVQPGASKNSIELTETDQVRIPTTVSSLRGKANRAIIQITAKILGAPGSSMEIVQGDSSRSKQLHFNNMTASTAITFLRLHD